MINVVCAVIRDDVGRVFACRRPEGKSLAGKWEFPGGKVEEGEKDVDALKREIAEELGCRIHVGEPIKEVLHDYDDFSIRLLAFQCRLLSENVRPLEHAEVRWVELEVCPSLDWADADVPVWQALLDEQACLGLAVGRS